MPQLENRKVAQRYAKALMECAEEQGQWEKVTAGMDQLHRLYLEVPEMNRFFSNPVIPLAEKTAVYQEEMAQALPPLVANLLQLLLDNERMALLPEILEAVLALVQAQQGLVQAEVTVPVPLDDALEKKLRKTLETVFEYQKVELNVKVDPAILAGATIRLGDKLIDGSYLGKLEMLRKQVG